MHPHADSLQRAISLRHSHLLSPLLSRKSHSQHRSKIRSRPRKRLSPLLFLRLNLHNNRAPVHSVRLLQKKEKLREILQRLRQIQHLHLQEIVRRGKRREVITHK